MPKSYREMKINSGLEVGMNLEIINLNAYKQPEKRKKKIITGKIVEIPNKFSFLLDNGIWKESFNFKDIDLPNGIAVKVVGVCPVCKKQMQPRAVSITATLEQTLRTCSCGFKTNGIVRRAD